MRFVAHIISLFLLLCSLPLVAQESHEMYSGDTLAVMHSRIYYPVNEVDIYEDYMTNPAELEQIKHLLHSTQLIDSITIYSYASPEGSYTFNKWLAAERGQTAKRYILANIPAYRNFPDSLIHIQSTAENWAGMREEIEHRYTRADKVRVLEIIDMPGVADSERKRMLAALDGGSSWQYILDHIMPHLRYATWITVWHPAIKMAPVASYMPVPAVESPRTVRVPALKSQDYYSKTILAVKTNMLYDALTWLNYSIEVPFAGEKFSALLYHQFPWWRWGQNDNEYCMRFLGVGAEARYWFLPQTRPETPKLKIRDCLVGHYVGLYGESGMYDFERKTDICYQGEYWSVGLSYGYSMPICKYLNLEFAISGGYASIAHRGYTPSPDYEILWRDYTRMGRWHYWGITKLQVSLVVPIIVNLKKGARP